MHEGIPIVLLEAMCLGKPIVATKTGGIPEVFNDGTCGFLVPPANPQHFADACEKLIRNVALQKRFSDNSNKTVKEKFSLSNTVEKTFNIYKEVIFGENSVYLGCWLPLGC